MTIRDDLLISPAPQVRSGRRGPTAAGVWTRLLGVLNSPDFFVALYFCTAGLLLSMAFMRMFPDFGELAVSTNIFP